MMGYLTFCIYKEVSDVFCLLTADSFPLTSHRRHKLLAAIDYKTSHLMIKPNEEILLTSWLERLKTGTKSCLRVNQDLCASHLLLLQVNKCITKYRSFDFAPVNECF